MFALCQLWYSVCEIDSVSLVGRLQRKQQTGDASAFTREERRGTRSRAAVSRSDARSDPCRQMPERKPCQLVLVQRRRKVQPFEPKNTVQ